MEYIKSKESIGITSVEYETLETMKRQDSVELRDETTTYNEVATAGMLDDSWETGANEYDDFIFDKNMGNFLIGFYEKSSLSSETLNNIQISNFTVSEDGKKLTFEPISKTLGDENQYIVNGFYGYEIRKNKLYYLFSSVINNDTLLKLNIGFYNGTGLQIIKRNVYINLSNGVKFKINAY